MDFRRSWAGPLELFKISAELSDYAGQKQI